MFGGRCDNVPAAVPDPPAAGAELGQVAIATVGALVMTAILVWIGTAYRSGRGGLLEWVDRTSRSIGGLPGWAGSAGAARPGHPGPRAVRPRLGRVASHRRRPRRRPARQPLALPAARRACSGSSPPAGSPIVATPRGRPPSPSAVRISRRLVRAGRRPAHPRRRRLRAARLPARRRLAPAVRPGRDALGRDPPDDDVGGRDRGARDRHPALRGAGGGADRARRRHRPGAGAAAGLAAPAAARARRGRLAPLPADARDRRHPRRALDLPGRVRLRRPPVPACCSTRC